jgi:hypothetical protein
MTCIGWNRQLSEAAGLPLCPLFNFGKPRLERNVLAEVEVQHEIICVFCVHLLSSALKFLLACSAAVLAHEANAGRGKLARG